MSITKDLFEFAKRDSDGLYSLSISENGKTETFKRILANDTNNVFSVSKVFTVTAIGFLVDDGLLSLDEKISDIFAAEMPDGRLQKRLTCRFLVSPIYICERPRRALPISASIQIACRSISCGQTACP